MLAEKKKQTTIGILGGLVATVLGYVLVTVSQSGIVLIAGGLLTLAGIVLYVYGCINYASGKGYSGALGLIGLFTIGLIVLVVLPDKHKQGRMADAPLMAPAGAYDGSYGTPAYGAPQPAYGAPGYAGQNGYGAQATPYSQPDPFVAGVTPAAVSQQTTTGYVEGDPFAGYAAAASSAAPVPAGGNGYGSPGGNGYGNPGGNGHGSGTFDQPAPDFQWEAGAQPAPATTAKVAAGLDEGYPLPAATYDPPAYAAPQTLAGQSGTEPGLSNWPPAGHWSSPSA